MDCTVRTIGGVRESGFSEVEVWIRDREELMRMNHLWRIWLTRGTFMFMIRWNIWDMLVSQERDRNE